MHGTDMLMGAAAVAASAIVWNMRSHKDGFKELIKECAQTRQVQNETERQLFLRLQTDAQTFVAYVQWVYPNDPRTQSLSKWNGSVLPSTRPTGATFFPDTGCLVVNPTFESQRTGVSGYDRYERLLTRLLHELAHSNVLARGHDPTFYDTQRWFLRIATAELGWKVQVNCRVCCGLEKSRCTPDTVCPKCTWLETNCTTTAASCQFPTAP